MNASPVHCRNRATTLTGAAIAFLILACVIVIFFVAPTESTMGDVQRIVYLHVSVAWCGLAGMIAMGFCGVMYLGHRRLTWDFWLQGAGEVGWLCATLTLITGSLWAHEAWGTWWTWEPRLMSSLVLWMMYSGIMLIRSSVDDPHRRARISAVFSMVSVSDVPLVLMATRWFRGVHPIAPEMDSQMRVVLITTVVSFTALFAYLIIQRFRQLLFMESIVQLETSAWYTSVNSQRSQMGPL